jgi:hypothetical protein
MFEELPKNISFADGFFVVSVHDRIVYYKISAFTNMETALHAAIKEVGELERLLAHESKEETVEEPFPSNEL